MSKQVYVYRGFHIPVHKTSWSWHDVVVCVAEVVQRQAAEKYLSSWLMSEILSTVQEVGMLKRFKIFTCPKGTKNVHY